MEKLLNWAMDYFEYRKAALGSPRGIIKKGGGLELDYGDYRAALFCFEELPDNPPKPAYKRSIIVTWSSHRNINKLALNWKNYCQPGLTLYLICPEDNGRKWSISPLVHSRVCDSGQLKKSLNSLADAACKDKI